MLHTQRFQRNHSGNENEVEPTTVSTFSCKLYQFIMSVGITGTLCVSGIFVNILTVIVFRNLDKNSSDKKGRSSANFLLSSLAVSDMFLLLTLFIMKTVPTFISFTQIDPNFFVSYVFAFLIVYGWPCVDVAQSVNTWITVLVAAYRFIAIVFPHKSSVYCTCVKAKMHLTLLCAMIFVWEIPIFIDNKVEKIGCCT